LDIDPPLDGWALSAAEATWFANFQLYGTYKQGHWRLPSKSTSKYNGKAAVRLKKGLIVKQKITEDSDNKGFNWQTFDLISDADNKAYDHAEFISFDNHYCPEVCELCKAGDLELINGRCHGKCSFDGKCGSVGTDCSGCSHLKYAKAPVPYILEQDDVGKYCDGSGVDSKVDSRKECELKANSKQAFFYSYAESFGPQGEKRFHCMHSNVCIPQKRIQKNNGIPWKIYYRPTTYRQVESHKKCVRTEAGGKNKLHFLLTDITPKQSTRTFENCKQLAMDYGFQFFMFKKNLIYPGGPGKCEIAKWQDCLQQAQYENWMIYGRGFPRVEEESALASSAEEPKVIDITETLKRELTPSLEKSPSLEESVATLEMTEPKFSMIQVFAVIGVIFISYSAYKRCNKSDYVDVPGAVEPAEI